MMVSELYEALKAAGVSDEQARQAAEAVLGAEHKDELVTKDYLRAEMMSMKAELVKWNVGTLLAMTGLFAAIVKLL